MTLNASIIAIFYNPLQPDNNVLLTYRGNSLGASGDYRGVGSICCAIAQRFLVRPNVTSVKQAIEGRIMLNDHTYEGNLNGTDSGLRGHNSRRVVWTLLEGRQLGSVEECATGKLFNEIDFWCAFNIDLRHCRRSVVLLSPFADAKGGRLVLERLAALVEKGIAVTIYTRPPESSFNVSAKVQVERMLNEFSARGIRIIFVDKMHQKVALIDERICWEGSLNILSHKESLEQMRRLEGANIAAQMKANLRLP